MLVQIAKALMEVAEKGFTLIESEPAHGVWADEVSEAIKPILTGQQVCFEVIGLTQNAIIIRVQE